MLTALLVSESGCVHHVRERCGSCVVVDGRVKQPSAIKRDAERLFVIVPGVLGYGWEWDEAVRALAAAPRVDFVVFWWEPWGSLHRAGRELADVLVRLLWLTPRTVREVVVVGHSVGGMVAAKALGGLVVPANKRLRVVTIGAPFAGMMGTPNTLDDPWYTPAMIAVMGTFKRYPDPPRGVDVVEYATSYPSDPVMQPRYGHHPAPPQIGPRGARRVAVDPKFDHNEIVSLIVRDLLEETRDHTVLADPRRR